MGRKIGKGDRLMGAAEARLLSRIRPKGPIGGDWDSIKRTCCYIDPDGGGCCLRDAEFEIVPVGDGVDWYDTTDACEEHVGELLGDINGAATHFEVWPRPVADTEDAGETE